MIRFYFDKQTAQPHIYNHAVNESEVEDVLAAAVEDRPGYDGARIAIGQTRNGRYLKIVYVPDGDDVFVITAYDLTGKALTAFKRRRRKKSS